MRRHTPQTIGPWRRRMAPKAASSRAQRKRSSSCPSVWPAPFLSTLMRTCWRKLLIRPFVIRFPRVGVGGALPVYFPFEAIFIYFFLSRRKKSRRRRHRPPHVHCRFHTHPLN